MRLRNIVLFIVISALLFGTIYATGQQILRQGGNDPQVQFAEDIAGALGQGTDLKAIIGATKFDITKSLAPFLVVLDSTGTVLATTGQIDNQLPVIPHGVLDASKKSGENRVTWQPKSGIRIALVVVPYAHGFVAVGRSLREVEVREHSLLLMAGAGWFASIIVCLLGVWWMKRSVITHS